MRQRFLKVLTGETGASRKKRVDDEEKESDSRGIQTRSGA